MMQVHGGCCADLGRCERALEEVVEVPLFIRRVGREGGYLEADDGEVRWASRGGGPWARP